MARGQDQGSTTPTPPRRNPFVQKIASTEDIEAQKKEAEEKREAQYNKRTAGSLEKIRASIPSEERKKLDEDIYSFVYDPQSNRGLEGIAEIIAARYPNFNREYFIDYLSDDGGKTMKPGYDAGEEEYLEMLKREFIGIGRLEELAMEEIARDGDVNDFAYAQENGTTNLENEIAREIWLRPENNEYFKLSGHPSFEDWVFATNLETFAQAVDHSFASGDFLRSFL